MTSASPTRIFPITRVPSSAPAVPGPAESGTRRGSASSARTAGPAESGASLHADHRAMSRRPWTIRALDTTLLVRGARPADLGPVAALHHRCSPSTLLYRFRSGGNPPSVSALQHMLSRPSTVVVCTTDGRVVAWGAADPDLSRPAPRMDGEAWPASRAEIGVVVEDGWQSAGIGRALVGHLAAAALLAGRRELVTPAATSAAVSQRLLSEIGATRRIEIDGETYLRVLLPESAAAGLGALQRLGTRS